MKTRKLMLCGMVAVVFAAGVAGTGRVARAEAAAVDRWLAQAQTSAGAGNFGDAYRSYENAFIEASKTAVYSPSEPGTGSDYRGGLDAMRRVFRFRTNFGDWTAAAEALRGQVKKELDRLSDDLNGGKPQVFMGTWRAPNGTVWTMTQYGAEVLGSATDGQGWRHSVKLDITVSGDTVTATGEDVSTKAGESDKHTSVTMTLNLRSSNQFRTGRGAYTRVW